MRPRILAVAMSAAIAAGILASGYVADAALTAQPVALSDANTPPTVLRYVQPHHSVTYASEDDGYNCLDANGRGRSFFTEVSAYAWNG